MVVNPKCQEIHSIKGMTEFFFVKLTRKYKSKDDIQDYLLANFFNLS